MSGNSTRPPGRAAAEFSEAVKSQLAAEAGYRCANPACLAATHAAGATQAGVGKVGQAAHISAAAEGFARWQPGMDPQVRKSAANGIWLCNVHAREIDIDEHRFTTSLLHGWKRRARRRALTSRGVPAREVVPDVRAMIRHASWLGDKTSTSEIHLFVARFLNDVGAHWLWSGTAYDAVRMALYELILNAVQHGEATHLHLRARGYRIDLAYVGSDFDPNVLVEMEGNGGSQAMRHLRGTLGETMSVAYTHNGTVATVRFIDVGSAGPNQPCALRGRDLRGPWTVRVENCDVVHVFFSGLLSFSDVGAVHRQLVAMPPTQRAVLHGLSAPLAEFATQLPNVSVAPTRSRPPASFPREP